MAVNWYWKAKLGEIVYKDLENKQTWKLEMFGGNMMCAFIYRFKNEEGKKMYNFFMWLNDMQHAKRVFKDDTFGLEKIAAGEHKVIKVKLNINSGNKYSDKEMLQFGKLLAEKNYKVELYGKNSNNRTNKKSHRIY